MRSFFPVAGGVLFLLAARPVACTGTPPDSDDGATTTTGKDGGAVEESFTGPIRVAVRMRSTGAPKAGARVVFYDASGVVLEDVATSADGTASRDDPAVATVTLFSGSPDEPRYLTFLGTRPGDTLHWVVDEATVKKFAFTVDAPSPLPAGSTAVQLAIGSCVETVGVDRTTPAFDAACLAPGGGRSVFLVALARDGVYATALDDVVFEDPPASTPLTFREPWARVADAPPSVVATGLPTAVAAGMRSGTVGLTHHLGVGSGGLSAEVSKDLSPSELTLSPEVLRVPGPAFQQDELAIVERRADPPTTFFAEAVAVRGPVAVTKSFAFGAPSPRIDSVEVSGLGAPRIELRGAAALASMKGFVGEVRWNLPVGTGTWRIVGPPTSNVLEAPPLPAAYAAIAPPAPATWREPVAAAFDGSAFASYASFRRSNVPAVPYAALLGGAATHVLPLLSSDGSVRLTAHADSRY